MPKRKTFEFLQLTSTFPYPPAIKGTLSTVHSTFIDQAIQNFDGTRASKSNIIHRFNCITYMYVSGDSLAEGWNPNDPFNTYLDVDDDVLEEHLHDKFLSVKNIDWVDVPIKSSSSDATVNKKDESADVELKDMKVKEVPKTAPVQPLTLTSVSFTDVSDTDKSDLYIQPPVIPQFDVNNPIASGNIDGNLFAVFSSFPQIPTKQNEISATTNVDMMMDKDLLKLFPKNFIRTRAECMYMPCEKIEMHPLLGLILPIHGYTRAQLIDNLIKYPHLFKLQRNVEDKVESFYSSIEIDGELKKILEIWYDLPESLVIPHSKEFIKEYVVRRYLLERDIKGIEHRYSMYGTLDPYLTLFAPADVYANMGYNDSVELARACVKSRVSYKQSRNPVLRRLAGNV